MILIKLNFMMFFNINAPLINIAKKFHVFSVCILLLRLCALNMIAVFNMTVNTYIYTTYANVHLHSYTCRLSGYFLSLKKK